MKTFLKRLWFLSGCGLLGVGLLLTSTTVLCAVPFLLLCLLPVLCGGLLIIKFYHVDP